MVGQRALIIRGAEPNAGRTSGSQRRPQSYPLRRKHGRRSLKQPAHLPAGPRNRPVENADAQHGAPIQRIASGDVAGIIPIPEENGVTPEATMPGVKIKENEPFDVALRRFRRSCEKAGVLTEVRKREYYEKPTTVRKRKAAAAVKRQRRRRMSSMMPYRNNRRR